jgi:hypothetical protein
VASNHLAGIMGLVIDYLTLCDQVVLRKQYKIYVCVFTTWCCYRLAES